jgi:hypothetical protein
MGISIAAAIVAAVLPGIRMAQLSPSLLTA